MDAPLDDVVTTLPPEQREAYSLLGWLPAAVLLDTDMVAAACDTTPAAARTLLHNLKSRELLVVPMISVTSVVQYSVPESVHADMLCRADPDHEKAVLQRVCEWFLTRSAAADWLLMPDHAATLGRTRPPVDPAAPTLITNAKQALSWFDRHVDHLLDILDAAAAHGRHDLVWRTVDAWWPTFHLRRHYEVARAAHDLAVDSARLDGNRPAQRQLLLSGAILLSSSGRTAKAVAWYNTTLNLATQDAPREGYPAQRDRGQALHGLAALAHGSGDPQRALTLQSQAFSLWEECGYDRGLGLSWHLMAEIYVGIDNFDAAVEAATRAQAIFDTLPDPDRFNSTRACALVGYARARLGDIDHGIDTLQGVRTFFSEAGAQHHMAQTAQWLGDITAARGDTQAARGHYEEAILLYPPDRPEAADAARTSLAELNSTPASAPGQEK